MLTETTRKITMPWGQVWSSKGATITPAVSHFWLFWERTHLHRPRQPESAEDVFGIHFWFHPGINEIYKFSWHLQGWGKLWDGVDCPNPARTLGDLRAIWLGEVVFGQRIDVANLSCWLLPLTTLSSTTVLEIGYRWNPPC